MTSHAFGPSTEPDNAPPDLLSAVTAFLAGRVFREQIRGCAPHVLHVGPAALDDVLSWNDLARLLGTCLFVSGNGLQFTRARTTAPLDSYSRVVAGPDGIEDRELVPDRCDALFNDGYTVKLSRVDRRIAAIRALCQGIERTIGDPVTANAYAVRDEVDAFGPHCDGHEILVLQVDGAKRWRIYGPGLSDRLDPKRAAAPNTPALVVPPDVHEIDVTLQAGDILYLPRAWWHSPIAVGGPSLHLTVALHTLSAADVLRDLVETNPFRGALRDCIQSDSDDASLEVLAEQIAETVRRELTGSVIRAALDRRALEAIPHRPVNVRPLPVLAAVGRSAGPSGSPDCYRWVASRPVRRRNDGEILLIIGANDREIAVPVTMAPLLDHLERIGSITANCLTNVVGEAAVPFARATLRRLSDMGLTLEEFDESATLRACYGRYDHL